MIDGGLIVGYLTTALLRGGRRWADQAVDSALDRLVELVRQRMGPGAVERLGNGTDAPAAHRDVGLIIEGAAMADPDFGRQLADLIADLDRRGGRQMLNQVYAQNNVQAFDHGVAVGRDFNYLHAPDPSDYSAAPGWIKVCIVVGFALTIAGLTLFMFSGLLQGDSPSGKTPAGVPIGIGVALTGMLLTGAGQIGRQLSRRR